jgi:hypothetical protein
MSGRWWRAYSRARHDPKLLKLSDKHFRWWFNFVCVAADNDGILPPHADLAVEFRASGKVITEMLDILIGAGLLDHDETGIHPHNWNGLQYVSDSSGFGTGSTKRVQRYRDKRKALGLPALGDYTKFKPALIKRDGARCVYCEATDKLVVDHMVPIALGGTDAQDNLALACKPCNSGKAGRTPELANMIVRVTSAADALARYRDSTRNVTVTETPSETETETETETESETEQKQIGERASARRAHRIPDDWTPSDDLRAFAEGLGLNVSAVAANFVDYWKSASGSNARKLDWDAAFRVWCRRQAEQPSRSAPVARESWDEKRRRENLAVIQEYDDRHRTA